VAHEEIPLLDDYSAWLSIGFLVSGHLQGLSDLSSLPTRGFCNHDVSSTCKNNLKSLDTTSMRGCTTVLALIGSLRFVQQVDGNAVHGKLLQAMAYGLPVSLDRCSQRLSP
jgi:hypothetical protein